MVGIRTMHCQSLCSLFYQYLHLSNLGFLRALSSSSDYVTISCSPAHET